MNARKDYRILARSGLTKDKRMFRKLAMEFALLDKVDGDSVSEVVSKVLNYKPRTPKWKEYRL